MDRTATADFPVVRGQSVIQPADAVWLTAMVLLWGFSWPVMKVSVELAPPLWLATLRFATGSACLFLLLAVRRQLRVPARADWPIIASVGGLQMMAFTALGLIAMQHTDAGRAALLAYTTPLWGVVAAWLFVKQTPTRYQILALAVGLSGIALICSPLEMDWSRPGVLLGAGLLLVAAICWSLVILHVRRHTWASRPIELAPWQMLLATLPLLALAITFEGRPDAIDWTPRLLGMMFYFGPIATSACFVISSEVGRKITTFAMSNVTLGVPVVGILASIVFLGERVTGPLVIGLVLIVAGVVLAAIAVRKKAEVNPATRLRSKAGAANWPGA